MTTALDAVEVTTAPPEAGRAARKTGGTIAGTNLQEGQASVSA